MSINFHAHLNAAQYEAATSTEGPVLVIAGAGSGKTRTIVHRLAYLVEQGVSPAEIVLLTFTRKASAEMLHRAQDLLGHAGLGGVRGGTFHGFAYTLLRQYAHVLGFERGMSIMDRGDAEEILMQGKDRLQLGKGDRKFPKRTTIMSLISKSRNKELPLSAILQKEAYHLGVYEGDLERLAEEYTRSKLEYGLVDYDDLLFLLERLLTDHPQVREQISHSITHIMVDEYQDTNLVQARLVALLTKPGDKSPNVMAVGDDAQSIYAFRGANIRNILDFPQTFSGTKIIKLEQNYRSTQPILELTNSILQGFTDQFSKRLFSDKPDTQLPEHIFPFSDRSQARLVTAKIVELAQTYPLDEIAVLFRAGYQSYHVEVELNKIGLSFRKYGGIKFSEAAHIKDILSFLRVSQNIQDVPSWQRILSHIPGIGPKTAQKLHRAIVINDQEFLHAQKSKRPGLETLLFTLDGLRTESLSPASAITFLLDYYLPIMREKFPDDHPRREMGLEELRQIAQGYDNLDVFLSDLSLENPDPQDQEQQEAITLSTVHSAKGLEWDAVLIIDLVEDRFPSKHALNDKEDFQEERRLLYVACTRARSYLALFSPETLYSRELQGSTPTNISPFLQEIPPHLLSCYREQFAGGLSLQKHAQQDTSSHCIDIPSPESTYPPQEPSTHRPVQGTYCRHKIFGRGKVVARVEPNKYKINFPGFGLKLIIEDYVQLEQS